jgi:homeobox protein cut-like
LHSVRGLEAQISDLQAEASRLLRNLDFQKEEAARLQREHAKRDEERDAEFGQRTADAETLRERLEQYADYDEVKRELDIMKVRRAAAFSLRKRRLPLAQYVEFAGLTLDDEDLDDSISVTSSVRMPDPNADKANKARGKPLENLLMSKNRKLQEQLTSLRVRGMRPIVLVSADTRIGESRRDDRVDLDAAGRAGDGEGELGGAARSERST